MGKGDISILLFGGEKTAQDWGGENWDLDTESCRSAAAVGAIPALVQVTLPVPLDCTGSAAKWKASPSLEPHP